MDHSAEQVGAPAESTHDARKPDWPAFDSFRRQELAFIKLNLAAVAALTLVHLAFGRSMGYPSTVTFALLAARFVDQSLEWHCLRRLRQPLSAKTIRVYSWVSPLAAIFFAFLLTIFCGMEDAHYHLLMVIPIVAAAFRFPLRWVLVFVALAGAMTILGVLLVNGDDSLDGTQELFEAVTVVMIYVVVGTVVWIMSEHLRQHASELRRNYDQLKSVQARLLKEERHAAVGRLAMAIAHEIRNPVAAIASSLAAADGESLPPSVRSEMSRIAVRETARLEKLTNDFLSYARVKPLELRPTDVADVVKYVADVVIARAAESSVAITTHCAGDVRGMMDDFQVHGALLNLAMNAIDASPRGARVEIGAVFRDSTSADPKIELSVRNQGRAIPASVAEHVFEPFITTKASGTGLGLAIARNVAVAHGGTLELTENQDDLIRFTLTIPYRPCPPAASDAGRDSHRISDEFASRNNDPVTTSARN